MTNPYPRDPMNELRAGWLVMGRCARCDHVTPAIQLATVRDVGPTCAPCVAKLYEQTLEDAAS